MVSKIQKKPFKIVGMKKGYTPRLKSEPNFYVEGNGSDFRELTSPAPSHRLYIENKARSTIFKHISWGSKTKSNVVEQGGILLGHVYFDEEAKLTYGVAEEAVPAKTGKGSPTYLKLSHETWSQMLTEKDKINDSINGEKLQVIGWYHTHPNSLDVFMSGTDVATQKLHFKEDWHFAIVLNPHRLIWKSFWGSDALPCKAYFSSGLYQVAKPSVEVEDTPSVEVEDTPSVEVEDTPSVEVEDTPSVEVEDTPSVEVEDTPSVEVEDTPSVKSAKKKSK